MEKKEANSSPKRKKENNTMEGMTISMKYPLSHLMMGQDLL